MRRSGTGRNSAPGKEPSPGPLGVCDPGPSLTAVCRRTGGARPAGEAAPDPRVASPGDPSRGASSRSPRTFVPELAAKDSTWHVHFRVTPATWGSSYRRGITCYPCAPGRAAGFPAAETKERKDVRNTIRRRQTPSPRPGLGHHRHGTADGGARRDDRERRPAAYSAHARILGERPGVGRHRLCALAERPNLPWASRPAPSSRSIRPGRSPHAEGERGSDPSGAGCSLAWTTEGPVTRSCPAVAANLMSQLRTFGLSSPSDQRCHLNWGTRPETLPRSGPPLASCPLSHPPPSAGARHVGQAGAGP